MKRILVYVFPTVEYRNVGNALVDDPCIFGGWEITLPEGLHDCRKRVMNLLNYSLAFSLQLKKHGKPQDRQLVRHYTSRRIVSLLRGSHGWPPEHLFTSATRGELQSSLGQHNRLPNSRARVFPHQLTFSRNSQSLLCCGRRKVEWRNPCEFACYQITKVLYSQCEDTWIVKLAASGPGCWQRTTRSDTLLSHRTDELLAQQPECLTDRPLQLLKRGRTTPVLWDAFFYKKNGFNRILV
jgi:hypothetical protein